MRITIVLGAFLPVPPVMGGAVEKVWFALAEEFVRRGHEVVQISRTLPQLPRSEVIAGVRHLRIPGFDTPASLIWLKCLDLIYSLRVLWALPQADILVTNTFWLPMIPKGASRGRVYVHVARFPKGQMRLYRKAARLQAPSRAVARAIARELSPLDSRAKVIPYPAPQPHSASAPPAVADRSKKILFVGRVHPEKGVHLLIKAFAGVPRRLFTGWKLVIVGPTDSPHGGGGGEYDKQLRDAVEGSEGRVEMRGAIFDGAALENEFRDARIFAYPSLAETGESFGLAPLEAMSHRCGVLVSDLECFHDFVRDGETGFIFDHRASDPVAALRAKIVSLMKDESLLSSASEAGYRKSTDYSLNRVVDYFLNDFESLIQPNAARTSR